MILLRDVDNAGKAGDVTQVSEGYFRNFLQPRKLAVASTTQNLRFLNARKKESAVKAAREKERALELGRQLEKIDLLIKAKVGQDGKLFGSVTGRDVADVLHRSGFQIDKKQIELAAIHQIGTFDARVRLHAEVVVDLKVVVKG